MTFSNWCPQALQRYSYNGTDNSPHTILLFFAAKNLLFATISTNLSLHFPLA